MTDMVICQPPILEIATRMVIGQCNYMANKHDPQLSSSLRYEMTPERIGYRLMLFRESLGLKPSEMADLIGIPRTYWSRFEGGKRAITDAVAATLVERYGLSLDFIILGKWDKLPLDRAEAMRRIEAEKNI